MKKASWIRTKTGYAYVDAKGKRVVSSWVKVKGKKYYMPVSLGKLIKEGILSDILSIYRITIDQATGEKKNGEAVPDN